MATVALLVATLQVKRCYQELFAMSTETISIDFFQLLLIVEYTEALQKRQMQHAAYRRSDGAFTT